jgi:hypothetical protein
MMKRVYEVWILLAGEEREMRIASDDRPEVIGEIVRVMIGPNTDRPSTIIIRSSLVEGV